MSVGITRFNAFAPSKPAPRPIRAKGVASTETLFIVFPTIVGKSMRQSDTAIPKRIPSMMGFVAISRMDFFKERLSKCLPPGPVKERIKTAAILYKGTVPIIMRGAIPE